MGKLILLLPLVLLVLLVFSFSFLIPPDYNKVFEEAYEERISLVTKFVINPKNIKSAEVSKTGNPTRAFGCLSGTGDYTLTFTAQTTAGEKDFEFNSSWGTDPSGEKIISVSIPSLTKSSMDKNG